MGLLKAEIKAGAIILAAVALFGLIAVIIGGRAIWERYTPYRIRFVDATGLEPRAPVRLNGLQVGRVLKVRLAPEDVTKVEVVVGIKPDVPIFDTAKATVTYLSLIGDYYLAISQKQPGRRMPPGSLIASEPTADFSKLIASTSELARSMDELVGSIRPIFTEKNVTHLSEALRSVKPLVVDIQRLTTEVRDSVSHLDAVIVENRKPLAQAVVALKTDLEKIESALTSIERLAKGLDKWQQVGGQYADDILLNLVGASENLRSLSRELKEEPWRILYRPEPGERAKE